MVQRGRQNFEADMKWRRLDSKQECCNQKVYLEFLSQLLTVSQGQNCMVKLVVLENNVNCLKLKLFVSTIWSEFVGLLFSRNWKPSKTMKDQWKAKYFEVCLHRSINKYKAISDHRDHDKTTTLMNDLRTSSQRHMPTQHCRNER